MTSVVLVPYCPLPADSGGKSEMLKHLRLLRELGPCRLVSAATRPVGAGWTRERRDALTKEGFEVVLREDSVRGLSPAQGWGLAYAAACKALRLEKAFPHGNPYHRFAFPADWWRRVSSGADIAVFNYSYWAWLPCECPKALALHDLWSDFMWGGTHLETRDIASCDHVFVISQAEVARLQARGVRHVSWCPPAIAPSDLPLPASCALLGSANAFNVEGLRWLESDGAALAGSGLRVYGALADAVQARELVPVGRYQDNEQPYRDNGIVLFTTVQGMGLQIKTIEALACGRAIVARRGAVRGLPPHEGAWIEVDTPAEALQQIHQLKADPVERSRWAAASRAYYARHLDADKIRAGMRDEYQALASP